MHPQIGHASNLLISQYLTLQEADKTPLIPETFTDDFKTSFGNFFSDQHQAEQCQKYSQAATSVLLKVTDSTQEFPTDLSHPTFELISLFYSRVRKRALIKKNRKANSADNSLLLTDSTSENQLKDDILEAMQEEIDDVIRLHKALSNYQQKLSEEELNKYKHENTWFKGCTNNIVLECIEVGIDGADKGNSFASKITHMHSGSTAPALGLIGTFQLTGLGVSVIYLFLSIFTPLYKKYALKTSDTVINKWSLRYLIPSIGLLALGIVAILVPVVGMYIGGLFTLYSLVSNILKVGLYFHDRVALKKDTEANDQKIKTLTEQREQLHDKIEQQKKRYLDIESATDIQYKKYILHVIGECKLEHKRVTEELKAACAEKEILEVKRIKTTDNFMGITNLVRLGFAVTSLVLVVLSLIPGTNVVAAPILFGLLVAGTAVLAVNWVNKFRLIRKEKREAQLKAKLFNPVEISESSAAISRSLAQNQPTPASVDIPPEYNMQPMPIHYDLSSTIPNVSTSSIFAHPAQNNSMRRHDSHPVMDTPSFGYI